ncbi:MAG: TetR/AcrR family transcriptional regulator [Planctomycetota bacterium]|nr:TetR/AcrR family transcriptional regulator [Planctomycetota bacterium]
MTKTPRTKSAVELLGVRAQPKNARDRLLNHAIDLCYTRGFNAVGLDQIIAAAGVTKTTFYKHFAGKDELLIEAITLRHEWEGKAWARAVKRLAGEDPRAQLLGLFDVLDLWFNGPEFGGCLFLNAAGEFPNPSDPVHQVAAKHKRATREWFRGLAKRAGVADAGTFADLYTTLVEGTLVMRHVHGRDDAAKLTRPMVERLLEQFGSPG